MADDRDERAWREIEKQDWRDVMAELQKVISGDPGVHVAFEYRENEPFARLIIGMPDGTHFGTVISASDLRAQAERFMTAADMIEARFGPDFSFTVGEYND